MFRQWPKSHRIFKWLAKVLISLGICAGWSEPLLVAHNTLLEISCCDTSKNKRAVRHRVAHLKLNFIRSEESTILPSWFGYVEHSSCAVRTAWDIQIDGEWGAGRPKLTWKKLTERDWHEWKLTAVVSQERSTWRSGVRSAKCAASQLPGRGPTDVEDAPAPAC